MTRLLSSAWILCALPPMVFAQATTKGACSPVVTGGANNRFTFYCDGLTNEQGKRLLEILNRIAKDQLDPVAVMHSLDEIKALSAKGTSPESFAKGMRMYENGTYLTPKGLAQLAYERLSSLEGQHSNDPRVENAMASAIVRIYRSSYSWRVSEALAYLRTKNVDVANLTTLSNNINTAADVRKLTDAFGKLADSLPSP